MENQFNLFVFAGEPSGDLHGSALVHALKKKQPGLTIKGVAGPRMRKENVQGPLTMEDFEVMGFTDVILSLPRLIRQFYQVRNAILEQQPHAVILIDYPGFNLRMAKALRAKKYRGKIIQYVSPSVWAWGQHRITEMEKSLDLLMTIYPFETSYFSKSSLNVQYVGSPIKEQISRYTYKNDWKDALGIPGSKHLVALFPGSRSGEISRNLPVILEAASRLKQTNPETIFGISCINELYQNEMQKLISNFPLLKDAVFFVPKIYTYELMRDCRCAIAKSGTVTLELALHGCPTVVTYKLTRINRLYAKFILKTNLPFYCIVNVLAGKEVFPELIRIEATPTNLYHHLNTLFTDGRERNTCLTHCHNLSHAIGASHASTNAADAILGLLS